jgi:hypothetical protein
MTKPRIVRRSTKVPTATLAPAGRHEQQTGRELMNQSLDGILCDGAFYTRIQPVMGR